VPSQEEVTLAARLVHAGILSKEQATAVLKQREALRGQIAAPSLLDLLVGKGLITRTELMIFRDRPLEELQPFPKYVIHGKVAEGGMAQVYRATYKPLGVQVVLKVVKPELSRQDRFLLRFRREAGILMKLDHPGIVHGYDLAEQERVWYCAMEFAEGRDLQSIVEQDGPMKEDEALHAIVQVVRAVAYLDGRGIVHRDLKPSNIVMDRSGTCRIIDLGLCLLRGGMKEDIGEGVTVGTVEYLSPDLYSIGATLHHLVVGRVPILGQNAEETLALQVLGTFNPVRLVKAGATPKLVNLMERLLAKDRDERPASAQALVQELEARWKCLQPPEPAPVIVSAPAPAADAAPAPEPAGPSFPKLASRKEREPEEPARGAKARGVRPKGPGPGRGRRP
jgi:serine/threonine-protein kinase